MFSHVLRWVQGWIIVWEMSWLDSTGPAHLSDGLSVVLRCFFLPTPRATLRLSFPAASLRRSRHGVRSRRASPSWPNACARLVSRPWASLAVQFRHPNGRPLAESACPTPLMCTPLTVHMHMTRTTRGQNNLWCSTSTRQRFSLLWSLIRTPGRLGRMQCLSWSPPCSA